MWGCVRSAWLRGFGILRKTASRWLGVSVSQIFKTGGMIPGSLEGPSVVIARINRVVLVLEGLLYVRGLLDIST